MISNDSRKTQVTKLSTCEETKLESSLQLIVNNISQILQILKVDSKVFETFEKVFEQSTTLEDVIKAINEMSELTLKKITKMQPDLANSFQISKSERKKTNLNEGEIGTENYETLEKLLQKYEAEIRDHIRIEQQIKIYSDTLEESISEFENKVRKMEKENSDLKLKMTEIQRNAICSKCEPNPNSLKVLRKNIKASDFSIVHSKHKKKISIDNVS